MSKKEENRQGPVDRQTTCRPALQCTAQVGHSHAVWVEEVAQGPTSCVASLQLTLVVRGQRKEKWNGLSIMTRDGTGDSRAERSSLL